MKTAIVLIGNSDNKLTQSQWCEYIQLVRSALFTFAQRVHFNGGSNFDSTFQNACFVVEITEEQLAKAKIALTDIRRKFQQDAVAVVCGDTEMV